MKSARPIRLFVLIDALGWEFIKDKEFLTDLLPYRVPLRTVLGFSSGAIPTILTGVPPSQNGHWNLFYYDPETSPFRWLRHFDFLSDRLLENRVTRKLLKEMGRHLLGLGPLFECCVSTRLLPWFNWVEKKNIYASGGIKGRPSIFDRLKEQGVPFHVYSYHSGSDREILARAKDDIQRNDASFFFLYLSELDMFLHNHCKDPEKLERGLAKYAEGIGEVFNSAADFRPDVQLTIFSDHGMTPVEHRCDLTKGIRTLGLTMPRDYLAVYDSTMARYWFFNDQARERITAQLNQVPCGRIVPDQELRDLGVFFSDRRYGELVFLVNPGWLLSSSDFHGGGWNPVGMHGYHPDDPYSNGVFLTNSQPTIPVRGIADVYACMTHAAKELE